MRRDAFDSVHVRRLFAELAQEAVRFVRTCDATAEIVADHKVYMRYSGQGWEIPVPLTGAEAMAADPAVYLARFAEGYARLFGRSVAGMAVEITVWSVNARTAADLVTAIAPMVPGPALIPTASRSLFDAAPGRATVAAVVARAALIPGQHIIGPALITEAETTFVLSAGRSAMVLADGCIDITAKGP